MKHQLNPMKTVRTPIYRVLTAFMSFTMVLSATFGSMPPLEVAAAGYEAEAEEETVAAETAGAKEDVEEPGAEIEEKDAEADPEDSSAPDEDDVDEGDDASDEDEDEALSDEEEEASSEDEEAEEAVEAEEEEAEELEDSDVDEEAEAADEAEEEAETQVDRDGDAVRYISRVWNGSEVVRSEKTVSEYTAVSADTTVWTTGWYVVSEDVTIPYNYRVVVSGSVNLILCDGATLDAKDGITVSEGNALTIYAQENETGTLIATAEGEERMAGIGGGYKESGGYITITGGCVTATGGFWGAGIGGGERGAGGEITITGGEVTVKGGLDGAGIGGGSGGTGGEITITGGEVTVKGGFSGAGIGGGSHGNGGTITITGGTVSANGGESGAGIGGGEYGAGGSISINGGEVTATGGKFGAGIGCGDEGAGGSISINGGTVSANGGDYGAGIGGGYKGAGGSISINGGEVTATGGDYAAGIGGGDKGAGGSISINGGTVTATGGESGAGIGGGFGGAGGSISINDGTVIAMGGNGTDEFGGGAGIGGGYQGAGGSISINGGTVIAMGGNGTDEFGGGAGIGGGWNGAGGTVIINGGTVYANGGTNAVGIGKGANAYDNGTIELGEDMYLYGGDSEDLEIHLSKYVRYENHDYARSRYMTVYDPHASLIGAVVSLNVLSFDYDGSVKQVSVNSVTLSDNRVLEPEDYSISGTLSAANLGTYTVTVSGNAPVSGSVNLVWKIVSGASVKTAPKAMTGLVYTGTALDLLQGNGNGEHGTMQYALGTATEAAQDYSTTIPKAIDAGTYYVWYKVKGDENYRDTEAVSLNVTIARKSATVTAKAQTISLNGNIQQGVDKVTATDLVSGHIITEVTLTPSTTTTATINGTITPSAAVIEDRDTDVTANYNITYVNGGLTVNKIPAVITKVPTAKTELSYDGSDQELLNEDGTYTGGSAAYAIGRADGSKPADSAFKSTVPTGKNAGNYIVWVKAAGDQNHYDSEAVSINVSIAKAEVTVSGIKAGNKTYDATTRATIDTGSVVYTGKAAADTLRVTATLEFEDENVGTGKTVTISNVALSGTASVNYVLMNSGIETTSANITKRQVTVTALDQTVSINGTVNSSVSMAKLTGAVTGHELASISLSADTTVKTNNGTVSVSGAVIKAGDEDVTANYEITYADGRLVVLLGEKATVITAPSAKTLSYKGAAQELLSGNEVVSGGSIVYALKSGNTAPSIDEWKDAIPTGTDAKAYRVWYMAVGDKNHDDSEPAYVDVTIGKRAVTVTAKDQTVSLNGTIDNSVSMADLTGAVDGHTLVSVILTGSSTEHVTTEGVISANTAVINSGNTNVTSNYSITYADGTLSVNAVEAVVTEEPAALNPVYNAEAQKLVSGNAIAEGGSILYAVSSNGEEAPEEGFSAEIPTGIDAGVYHVWYKAAGDDDHFDSEAACVDVTIAEAEYSIIYHANDGSDAAVSKNETVGSAEDRAVVSGNEPERKGYIFNGWNDAEDGSGTPYANGDEYTPVQNEDKSFADLDLYAQWRAVSLDSISINTAQDKTEYFEGESFDATGMVVVATYTDGTTKTVSDYSITPSGALTVSDDHVTVSYTEGENTSTADQSITVIPITLVSISINTAPYKTEYEEGDIFSTAGMVVVANYNNSDTKEIEDYSFTPDGELTVSDDLITVSYTEKDITCTAEQEISVEYKKDIIEEDDEYFMWNLYEDSAPKELKIKGISGNAAVANSNAKSSVYYDATLSGNIITVSLKGDPKEAAKEANALLEFKVSANEIIEYSMPVEYKKPTLKLSTTSVTIKNGVMTAVETKVLYKTAGGNFEPLELGRDSKVTFVDKAAEIKDGGIIVINENGAKSGKISILGEGWNAKDPVELKFTVKAVDKDVITVDLGDAKNVVVNKNAKGQIFTFPVYLNGVLAGEDLSLTDKANTGLATYENGVLTVAYPEGGDIKAKTYTVTLSKGAAKADVKIKVSNKELTKSIQLKVQSKYDVVTGQKMVIVPNFKEVGGEIEEVSVTNKDFHAVLNDAGNIVVDYEGNVLNAKNLKIGDLSFKLKISDIDDEVTVTLKNVKAKKTNVKVKAAKVSLGTNDEAVANIVCSYKDASGAQHLIAPESITIKGQKNVKAVIGEDKTSITVSNLTKNSGSVTLTLGFHGGITKNVTVKVKK